MLVSWNWLKEYVSLEMSVEALTEKLLMSGLNLEEYHEVDSDICIDLEVTSNRPDCLGHLGIAREVSVLFDLPLLIPSLRPVGENNTPLKALTSVTLDSPDLCPRYSARVIRGTKIGPSPAWLQSRLMTIGVRPINNVVDATNYVMFECGQPLHAFDFDQLQGKKIIVRRGLAGEKIKAINGVSYDIIPEMCVIADSVRPVAIAGVMGGLETEISERTTNVLLEAAEFTPRSVRQTARALGLFSPSSYRFERGINGHQLDWASRRCAEIILETGGGELVEGAISVEASPVSELPLVRLRYAQIQRILGIEVGHDRVFRILESLGLTRVEADSESALFRSPSWRRDLTREADLIEEIARINGYEKIPEDVPVPLTISSKTVRDRVGDRVRQALTGQGYFEAITLSFVDEELFHLIKPRGEIPALKVDHSSRRKENILRQTLVPSLLWSRRENERRGHFDARLFEIARIYLDAVPGDSKFEPLMIGLVTEQSFHVLKGIVEELARAHRASARVTIEPTEITGLEPGHAGVVLLDGAPWGWIGDVSAETRTKFDLRDPASVAELDFSQLESAIDLTPRYRPVPAFPSIQRDLNLVLEEAVGWQSIEEILNELGGEILESYRFGGQYRGPQIPADKKSYIIQLEFRSAERTLTSAEVDQAQERMLNTIRERLGAVLR